MSFMILLFVGERRYFISQWTGHSNGAMVFFSFIIRKRAAFCRNIYSQLEVFLSKQVHLGGYYLHD